MTDSRPIAAAPVPSQARRVTFYEDRAEVQRRARVRVEAGLGWVALSGPTLYLDDRSLQAKVDAPGVRVVAARVSRRMVSAPALGREEIEKLELEKREAAEQMRAAACALDRSAASEARLQEALESLAKAMSEVPPGTAESRQSEWREAWSALDRGLAASLDARMRAGFEREDASELLERTEARLAQGRTERPRVEALVEVQLQCEMAGEVEVEITYRTPCALWRPEHLARLESDQKEGGQLELTTWATAWQATGERWEGVEACFSTARPAREASAPLLEDDHLYARRKSEEERRTVVVAAREQEIQTAGAAGAKTADEMPGVDDGGAPLAFRAPSPVTLPSDGQPHRIEIGRLSLDAKVERVLYPERSAAAHLKATATLTGATPLLAGPARLARGSGMVGRSKLSFVAPGEPFELGFGPDDGLRVRRTESDRRDQVFAVGTQILERTVRLFLSNLSDGEKRVRVTERIPVSELSEIDVDLKDAPGFDHLRKDGFLVAEVTLAARETREFALRYEVRAKSNVRLPF